MALSGLQQLNIELTSRCSKRTLCSMCGHQDQEVNPNLKFGDMDFELLKSIRSQLEPGPIIEFHRDGDPVDYPRLGEALDLFQGFITCLVTHGERLAEKADEIIDRCTTICVSVVKGDPDADIQYESVIKFVEKKGNKLPRLVIKYVGGPPDPNRYEKMDALFTTRILHVPEGNHRYVKRDPIIPESGICLDFLGRPAIDWRGRVFQCVKLDVTDGGLLGDLRDGSLESIWNGWFRAQLMEFHKKGLRDILPAPCNTCKYWGVPTG